jgi:hypothetical protein
MAERSTRPMTEADQGRERTAAPGRRVNPVLSLQRAVGNRATAQLLARKGGSSHLGTFENSVQIGSLGPIEIKQSNVGDWISHKASASDLTVTTAMGRHSKELAQMADGKTKVDSIQVQSLTGENSWLVVTFRHGVIRDYAADAPSKTEQWKVVDFDAVHIDRTSIGKPRP